MSGPIGSSVGGSVEGVAERITATAESIANDFLVLQRRQVIEYLALKDQMKRIETRMQELRQTIENNVPVRNDFVIYGGHEVQIREQIRENFALKEAKKHIKPEVLAPYLSNTVYTVLNIKKG